MEEKERGWRKRTKEGGREVVLGKWPEGGSLS